MQTTETTLSPQERRQEIAKILAVGVLRLKDSPLFRKNPPESEKTSQNCLEVSAELRTHGHAV